MTFLFNPIVRRLLAAVITIGAASNGMAQADSRSPHYQSDHQPEKRFKELKQDFERAFRDYYIFSQIKDGRTVAMFRNLEDMTSTDDGLTVSFKSAEVFDGSLRAADIDYTFRLQFDELPEVMRNGVCSNPDSISPDSGNRHSIKFPVPRKINFMSFRSDASFRLACDAMRNIAQRYQETEVQEASRFAELAAQYRSQKTKPVMTEQQRRLVVQANALTQERNFGEASERYQQLLSRDPLIYPAYFNLALL